MGVSASGTTNHKTYLKKISWGFSPLSSLDPPMLCGFVAMILLHNKDHQQNNPLVTVATPSAGKGRDMSELQAQLITA